MTEEAEAQFEKVYRENVRHVLAYALSRAETESAKDAVSQTFVTAWRKISDMPSDPLPWLIGITRKNLQDQWRSTRRRTALQQRIASEAATSSRVNRPPRGRTPFPSQRNQRGAQPDATERPRDRLPAGLARIDG